MNLFASMILQSLVRLVIYADQFIVRQQDNEAKALAQQLNETGNLTISPTEEVWGIDNTVKLMNLKVE